MEETYDGPHADLTWRILGSAIEVHRVLGPGLLEHTYRRCLMLQLEEDGLRVRSEVPIPIEYKGLKLDTSYRADLIVEDAALVELKAVEQVSRVHCLQTLTYLRLARLPVGLLVNFNVPRLKEGVRRFVNSTMAPETSP
jgi:GxxExxY protein